MWGVGNDGTVHIRIYNAEGKMIRDEFRGKGKTDIRSI